VLAIWDRFERGQSAGTITTSTREGVLGKPSEAVVVLVLVGVGVVVVVSS